MKLLSIAAVFLGVTLTFSASAHVSLKQSVPMKEAMLMQSPDQLELVFSGDVRLAKLDLLDSKKQAVDFSFKASATPNTTFSWPLPTLPQGNYTVNWVALGADGHKMSGEFSFMVHGNQEQSQAPQENANPHNAHHH